VNVKVGEPAVNVLQDKGGLEVIIGITEGEQLRTGTLDFKGALLEDETALGKLLKLKSGEIFRGRTSRTDVFTLSDL